MSTSTAAARDAPPPALPAYSLENAKEPATRGAPSWAGRSPLRNVRSCEPSAPLDFENGRGAPVAIQGMGDPLRPGEVAASPARILTAADETRRRIERDLHDGAQQRLVSLRLEVQVAEAMTPPELQDLRARLSCISGGLIEVLDELRRIASGVHPAVLTEGGLDPALKALARRSVIPVELDVRLGPRVPECVEVAAYYLVSEALTNAAKHSDASVVRIEVAAEEGAVVLAICDDGIGGADPTRGSGLTGLSDRVAALGGTLEISSPAGAGTAIRVTMPDAPCADFASAATDRAIALTERVDPAPAGPFTIGPQGERAGALGELGGRVAAGEDLEDLVPTMGVIAPTERQSR